jgi:DNA-binding MarR family transcriptional regulator
MKRTFNVVKADLARTLEPFGLRMITFTALILIVDNPDLSQTQLAGALAIERSNLVTIVDDLEKERLDHPQSRAE